MVRVSVAMHVTIHGGTEALLFLTSIEYVAGRVGER